MYYLIKENDCESYTIIDFENHYWLSADDAYDTNWFSSITETLNCAKTRGITEPDESDLDNDIYMKYYTSAEAFCQALTDNENYISCHIIAESSTLDFSDFQDKYPELFI